MKVRHVSQPDNTGCGLACLAMLTGNTYDEVKIRLIHEGLFTNETDYWGTTFKDMQQMLAWYNLKANTKRKFKSWRNIPAKIAIASTNYDQSGCWHWVIFVRDIDGFFIYDPGKRRKKIRDLRGKMTGWFIEIL